MMEVLVTDRQRGKTTALMGWVKGGHKTRRYPHWSRIVVIPTMGMLEQIKRDWWEKIEDFDHRVYHLDEIRNNLSFNNPDLEIRFDDMDFVLQKLFPFSRIGGFTMTGKILTPGADPGDERSEQWREARGMDDRWV